MIADRTYDLNVEGVGRFVFRKRTGRLSAEVIRRGLDYIGQPAQTPWQMEAGDIAGTLLALTAEAPDGWDFEALDLLDPEDMALARRVREAIREAEGRFRGRAKADGAAAGPGAQ